MMGGMGEFNTAVRTQRDLIVIICNDAAYGAEHIQMRDRGIDPSLTEFDWPSFAAVALSLGGEGVTVTSPEDLEDAILAIEARKGPIVVELKLDPNNVPRMRM
jgi:thiamine pyrophosphate-dependent acetolactate synthase large subunit-like protein